MQALYESKNASLENTLLESLAPDEPWSLIERFTTLVRESSSDDERHRLQLHSRSPQRFGRTPYHAHAGTVL